MHVLTIFSSPFALALEKSTLAKSLKKIFDEISTDGICYERINTYIEISFCMPQKVFQKLNPCLQVEPEAVYNCLEALRPYHGILLLYEERELLDKLPLDASPTLKKMLAHASPTKSFRTIASDSDLALSHVMFKFDFFISDDFKLYIILGISSGWAFIVLGSSNRDISDL